MAVVDNGVNVQSNRSEQVLTNHSTRMVDFNGKVHVNYNHYDDDDERHQFHRFNDDLKINGELAEMFSKLNPMAEEFVPPSVNHTNFARFVANHGSIMPIPMHFRPNHVPAMPPMHLRPKNVNAYQSNPRRRRNHDRWRKRSNGRPSVGRREDVVRRTVYVSDIDHQVTEEQLATLFFTCGQVVDCRICGDPCSVLRFAFVEFTNEGEARAALFLTGTVLGFYPVKVTPSKTAIVPVNPTFLPRSSNERDMCVRTIYCTNIDKKVTQEQVKMFFESVCGRVNCMRLLGDYNHATRIAFVEFMMAESAIAALNCSGVVLGALPIRVSPSKTPVRPRGPSRSTVQ